MATFARTRLAAVAVVLFVPAALYPLLGAWTLAWLPVAVGLLGVALARPAALKGSVLALARVVTAGRPEGDPEAQDTQGSDHPQEPGEGLDRGDEPEPVPAPRGQSGTRGVRLRRTALPSAAADYDFVFCARVHWRWAGRIDLRLRNPAGPASHTILLRAREVLARTRPEDHGLVEVELAALFAVEIPIADGTVEVWADEVRVELEDEDAQRLRRVVHLRKDRALWEAEHEAELARAGLRGGPTPPFDPAPASRPSSNHGSAPASNHDPDLGQELSGQIIDRIPDFVQSAPGSGIDSEGYESYWWPADPEEDEEAMQQDVRVAILRGLIDSVEDGQERVEFVRQQVRLLQQSGFAYVAERIQAVYPEH